MRLRRVRRQAVQRIRASRRKQKPGRRPESPSKRFRCLFGIWVRLERPRGLEGRHRLAHLYANQPCLPALHFEAPADPPMQ